MGYISLYFAIYRAGHAETAHNRIASVVLGFKEALLEEAEKKKDKQKYLPHDINISSFSSIFLLPSSFFSCSWKVIVLRVIVNILILCLLVLSASAVVIVVERLVGFELPLLCLNKCLMLFVLCTVHRIKRKIIRTGVAMKRAL